ncbi:MAG: hypothetical protein A2V70_06260 [Planctomycetes bacterium RBG_13_63_9]|nr:MAG: hypothetical protein A2V70_06260 [Planctomycetes bacterium RBG_13_63_9]
MVKRKRRRMRREVTSAVIHTLCCGSDHFANLEGRDPLEREELLALWLDPRIREQTYAMQASRRPGKSPWAEAEFGVIADVDHCVRAKPYLDNDAGDLTCDADDPNCEIAK